MQVFFGPPPSGTLNIRGCALCIGNFDGVHRGHQSMLEHLHKEADARGLPAALLTFEPHPREFFGGMNPPARLSTLRDKLDLLRQNHKLEYVFVYRFNSGFAALSAKEFIQNVLVNQLNTRYLLVGDDFCFGAQRQGGFELLSKDSHFVTEAMPAVLVAGERASSSLVRRLLADGDMQGAERLLGRPYQLSGRVIYGRQLGRSLGFPTANLLLPHRKPALNGVFVVEVDGPSGRYGGVASLGLNPTVSTSANYKLEVYLFDFSGDLYGKRLTVHFLKKLRDEERYDSLDALVAQIQKDAESARVYLNSM